MERALVQRAPPSHRKSAISEGQKEGVLYYTVGQRKGLDIGGIGPFYVVGKNVEKNELYVTDEAHQDYLYSDSCLVSGINMMADRNFPLSAKAKFRYRQQDNDVNVEMIDETTAIVRFPYGIRSVTPGQEAVIYHDDTVVFGGVIDVVYKEGYDLHERIRQLAEK